MNIHRNLALKNTTQRRQYFWLNGGSFGGCKTFKNCNTRKMFDPSDLNWKDGFPYFKGTNRNCLAAEFMPKNSTSAATLEHLNLECTRLIGFICQKKNPILN